MTLIYSNKEYKIYDGIDFETVYSHPKDGSSGLLIFIVEKWDNEVKLFERDKKIKKIIGDNTNDDLDLNEINNTYISIYERQNIPLDIIVDKIISTFKKGGTIRQIPPITNRFKNRNKDF